MCYCHKGENNGACNRGYKDCLRYAKCFLMQLSVTLGLHFGWVSGPGVNLCNSRYDIVIWRAENRTHLSKQTRPSTERSRKASYVRGIPSKPDDQLRWVLIVRTQV